MRNLVSFDKIKLFVKNYVVFNIEAFSIGLSRLSPVYLGCRNRRFHLCRGVRLRTITRTNFLDMIINSLMVRLMSWSFGKCLAPLHYHYSLVHSDPIWLFLKSHRLVMTFSYNWWWGSSPIALGNRGYFFIASTPSCSLTKRDNIC